MAVSEENGGEGEWKLRTGFGIQLVLGVPLAQHHRAPFVAEPFRFSMKSTMTSNRTAAGIRAESNDSLHLAHVERHPICRVLEWQRRLTTEQNLTKVKIGVEEGLSKARVTQLFSLLRLPQRAQDYLSTLVNLPHIQAFSVRQLRAILRAPNHQHATLFEKMKADCER